MARLGQAWVHRHLDPRHVIEMYEEMYNEALGRSKD
jgi:hypothetical protein